MTAVFILTAWLGSVDAPRPNIIAIVADDLGQWAVGAYGNRDVQTPNLDRLAREGAIFTSALVVTPVCSPSRASYLTGRWPTELGITDYLTPEEGRAGLGIRGPTWPGALASAGYRTGLFGKWHLGTQPPFHPQRHGFLDFFGFLEGGTTPWNAVLTRTGEPIHTKGPVVDVVTTAAIEFLQRHRADPMLLCIHYREPHLPYGPVAEEDSAPFRGLEPEVPRIRGLDPKAVAASTRAYYASIHSIDRNLGRLLGELDKLGLAERTVIWFTSDHGYNEGRHLVDTKGNGQWIAGGVRGPKRPNLWDTSMKVPLVVRWPGVVSPGRKISTPVSNLDTFRTMCAIGGAKIPEGAVVRGADRSPLLRGESQAAEPMFGMYDLHNGGLAYLRMIRTEKYKFVRHFRTWGMDELYDLAHDPGEENNLLRSRREPPAALERLRSQLAEWQRSIDDPILEPAYGTLKVE